MASKTNSFNIADLYKKVFGITGVRFAIPDSTTASNIAGMAIASATFLAGETLAGIADAANKKDLKSYFDASQIQTIPLPAANIKSVLGTPIYEQILFTVPAIVVNGVVTSPQFQYTIPDWPLFDITYQKQIVKTPLQGSDGQVKEYISDDDYAINIRGFLINYASQEYPEQLLQDFMKVMKAKTMIGITSQVFNLLDIHNIVIERVHLPGVEGYNNIQPFEIECSSDQPVELLIKSVATGQPVKPKITPGL